MKTKEKQLQEIHNQAFKLALEIVEERARKILQSHKNLEEFCMGMGTWFFNDKDGTHFYDGNDKFTKRLADFMDNWDIYLHLTGHPMRFTAEGPVINDW